MAEKCVCVCEIILTCVRINEIHTIVFEEMPAYNGGLTFANVCFTASLGVNLSFRPSNKYFTYHHMLSQSNLNCMCMCKFRHSQHTVHECMDPDRMDYSLQYTW
jgi:hypothetical protein